MGVSQGRVAHAQGFAELTFTVPASLAKMLQRWVGTTSGLNASCEKQKVEGNVQGVGRDAQGSYFSEQGCVCGFREALNISLFFVKNILF